MEKQFDGIAFARRIRRAIQERGLSQRGAARAAAVDYGTFHRVVHGGVPSAETLVRILHWLEAGQSDAAE